MTYKTILVHCDAGKSVASRLDVAVGLTPAFNAHLVALQQLQQQRTLRFVRLISQKSPVMVEVLSVDELLHASTQGTKARRRHAPVAGALSNRSSGDEDGRALEAAGAQIGQRLVRALEGIDCRGRANAGAWRQLQELRGILPRRLATDRICRSSHSRR